MATLLPLTKFEMNRMAHARAQELWLPGSPAGQNGHPQLTAMAKMHFGKHSWSDLDVDQMRKIYEHLDTNKRLPKKGELD